MFTKQVLTFCLLAFAISWMVFGIAYGAGAFDSAVGSGLTAFVFMWGPAIAALICALIFDKKRVAEALGLLPKFNKWLLIAWVVPIVLCVLAVVFSLLGDGVNFVGLEAGLDKALAGQPNPNKELMGQYYVPFIYGSALFLGAGINALLLISEELGWRGYLWGKIAPNGFWKACGFTGVIWGLWHTPLIVMGHNYGTDYPGFPYLGVAAMTLFCVLLTPIISYVRMKNGSMWSASLFHGTINAVAGVSILTLSTKSMMWNGIMGIGGVLVLILGCIWVWYSLRKMQITARI